MPYRRRSRSRRRVRSAPARRRRSYARKRSASKKAGIKVKNLAKAGKSKPKVMLLLKNPAGIKLFGIPKGSNRPVGIPLKNAKDLEIKVAKNGLARLSGKGPGGMKIFRGVGRAR